MSDIMDHVLQRRSIRRYTEQEVERDLLEKLLQAAMAAPTACNSQPCEFVVVTDREVLARLQARVPFSRYNPPAMIVVCGNPGIANNSAAQHYWIQDCCAATENILIAAAGLGLGAAGFGVIAVHAGYSGAFAIAAGVMLLALTPLWLNRGWLHSSVIGPDR